MIRIQEKFKKVLLLVMSTILTISILSVTALAADESPVPIASSEQSSADYETLLNTIVKEQPSSTEIKKDKVYAESLHAQLSSKDSVIGRAAAKTKDFSETEINNDFSTANVINNSFAGTPQYHVYGQINGNYQDVDVYRFTVTAPGTVTVLGQWIDKFAGLGWEDELLVGLFDSSHRIVAAASHNMLSNGSTARALFADISAGTYYIAVIQGDAYKSLFVGEKYSFELDYRPSSASPSVIYQSHVESIGWQNMRINGWMSGTSGRSLRLEAMQIHLKNANGGIQYQTHVQNIGWMDWVSDGASSGTSGRSLRLEAIRIRLTGAVANQYDIYYRVHAQNVGWMGWAKNGEASGTAGYSYRLEGIEIQLVAKGAAAPGSTDRVFVEPFGVSYQSHVQNIGWQGWRSNGETSGTSGQALRLEGMNIKLEGIDGGIEYRTHVQNIGWMNWVANGAMSGTSGRSLRLEAINIRLTGNAANRYDIYYRVHAQNVGWMGWAKNGDAAGTAGFSYRLEAIQIQLVDKGGAAPGSMANAFIQK